MRHAHAERPRIAIVSRLYPVPYEPNRAPFNRTQFKLLAERYDVSLLVPVPWQKWLRHRRQLQPERRDGLDVRYACFVFPPKIGRITYPAWFVLSVLPELRWFAGLRASCLIASWAYPDAVGAVVLGRALGLPVLVRAYGSDVNVHAAHPARAAQLRWAAKQAFAVVPVSEALKQRLVQIGVDEQKVSVIPTGVDRDAFAPIPKSAARAALGLDPGRRMIVFVGNLLRAKGVYELLAAFDRLAREHPELDLAIVGDGPERSALTERTRQAGLTQRVLLPGRVAHSSVANWINASDLLCLPSHREGLPNVLLEAMACGVPVVATRVGGIPEAVTADTGELVPPEDEVALVAALKRALGRVWSRDALTARAQEFSWEANMSSLCSLIDRAIHG